MTSSNLISARYVIPVEAKQRVTFYLRGAELYIKIYVKNSDAPSITDVLNVIERPATFEDKRKYLPELSAFVDENKGLNLEHLLPKETVPLNLTPQQVHLLEQQNIELARQKQLVLRAEVLENRAKAAVPPLTQRNRSHESMTNQERLNEQGHVVPSKIDTQTLLINSRRQVEGLQPKSSPQVVINPRTGMIVR